MNKYNVKISRNYFYEEIFEDDIETVLTKEKFENEAYKVV